MHTGSLLGTLLGDAFGLPCEGMHPAAARRIFGEPRAFQFALGFGMGSDDAEHAFLTAQCLLEAGGDVERFRSLLAWRLRWWFLGIPVAMGLATLRGCARLWLGISPERSGVFSAGNGPAMRAPIIGVHLRGDLPAMRAFVRASTRMTHSDPKAEWGSFAAALAAAEMANHGAIAPGFADRFRQEVGPEAEELSTLLERAEKSARGGESTEDFARELCDEHGVSGYMLHTIPAAIHACIRHSDFGDAMRALVRCGGDTDTTCAIAGGIIGAGGADRLPAEWLARIAEWPRSVAVFRAAGARLDAGGSGAVRYWWPALPLRNVLFLAIVLVHIVVRIVRFKW